MQILGIILIVGALGLTAYQIYKMVVDLKNSKKNKGG